MSLWNSFDFVSLCAGRLTYVGSFYYYCSWPSTMGSKRNSACRDTATFPNVLQQLGSLCAGRQVLFPTVQAALLAHEERAALEC